MFASCSSWQRRSAALWLGFLGGYITLTFGIRVCFVLLLAQRSALVRLSGGWLYNSYVWDSGLLVLGQRSALVLRVPGGVVIQLPCLGFRSSCLGAAQRFGQGSGGWLYKYNSSVWDSGLLVFLRAAQRFGEGSRVVI